MAIVARTIAVRNEAEKKAARKQTCRRAVSEAIN
jgi:hypothetical protein